MGIVRFLYEMLSSFAQHGRGLLISIEYFYKSKHYYESNAPPLSSFVTECRYFTKFQRYFVFEKMTIAEAHCFRNSTWCSTYYSYYRCHSWCSGLTQSYSGCFNAHAYRQSCFGIYCKQWRLRYACLWPVVLPTYRFDYNLCSFESNHKTQCISNCCLSVDRRVDRLSR